MREKCFQSLQELLYLVKKDVEKNLVLEIKTKKLEFLKYGAGNDLLLFLLTCLEYKTIYYLNDRLLYFREHKDFFSISNNLV